LLSAFVVVEAGRYRYRTSDHPQLPVRLAMLRKASEMGWLNGRRDSTMLHRAGSVLCATLGVGRGHHSLLRQDKMHSSTAANSEQLWEANW